MSPGKNLSGSQNKNYTKFGRNISLVTALLTVVTFGIAICTPPLSGPFCTGSCFEYPYTDIASRFPRDYYWMYSAIFLSFFYMIMMITIYDTTKDTQKLFGMMGVSFAIMASLILITNYFIQVSVIQPSVLAGETDGISLLTQFNPHGIFIALEEIGFFTMIFSFFVLVPIFHESSSLEKSIRWTAIISFMLAILCFMIVTIKYGVYREYRFEVIIISITWCELIIISFLISRYFKLKHTHADLVPKEEHMNQIL